MPIYEYHCNDCGAEFEAIVSFKNADAVACERCGGAHVERLASAFACTAPSAAAQARRGARWAGAAEASAGAS